MVLETFALSSLNHLTRLVAREDFIIVSNTFITHIQPSTGFGSMGPSSGRFFYVMSKRNTCLKVVYSLISKYV
jgi:hypothetical protein